MKRKLDNVAKLFSLDHKKDANIFRYSIILKETINEKVLKNALNVTIKYFKDFKVKLSKGFFWNYLEENDKEIK